MATRSSPRRTRTNSTTTPNFNATIAVRKRRSRTIDLTAPSPLQDDFYTAEAILDRISYAEQRLESTTRYLTPNSTKLLMVYKNACLDFHLDYHELTEDEKREHIQQIRMFDIDLSRKTFLTDVSSQSLLSEIITLRLNAYMARYGDYASHFVHHLRKEAAVKPQTAFASTISGQHLWTEISDAINRESTVWKRQRAIDAELVPTTYAVVENCRRAGIMNSDHMLSLIHLYADRNMAFHRGFKEDLEAKRYSEVAKCIFEDLRDLSSVCPPDKPQEEMVMRAVLEGLRDEWFDASHAPDQPLGWNHKPAIRAVQAQLEKSKTVKPDLIRNSAKMAAARLGLTAEYADLLVGVAITPVVPHQLPAPGPGPATTSAKGKTKVQKPSRPIKVSDRKKVWAWIMEQQTGQHEGIMKAMTTQREINRVVSQYRQTFGEDAPAP